MRTRRPATSARPRPARSRRALCRRPRRGDLRRARRRLGLARGAPARVAAAFRRQAVLDRVEPAADRAELLAQVAQVLLCRGLALLEVTDRIAHALANLARLRLGRLHKLVERVAG